MMKALLTLVPKYFHPGTYILNTYPARSRVLLPEGPYSSPVKLICVKWKSLHPHVIRGSLSIKNPAMMKPLPRAAQDLKPLYKLPKPVYTNRRTRERASSLLAWHPYIQIRLLGSATLGFRVLD